MSKFGTQAGRALAAGALVLGLGACANPQADQALFAQQAFVGMPAETLLSCAGVPDRQANVDNLDYFTYSSERIVSRSVPSMGFSPYWHPWYGWRYSPGWGAWDDRTEIESRNCEATFTLKNGTVQQVVYNSSSAGPSARLDQCYQIVENCLALVPQQQLVR
ncbi:hypothetical protein [Indioceanicola profundi]|uniref:hypothetical protein n=1 Tax=Indioceanicola profundi TaxID=2220096 RepID=UPI000E6AC985|nr:hypothetical protein [Indioceanicola profundi]